VQVRSQPYVDPFIGRGVAPEPEPPKRGREGIWVALAALVGAAAVITAIAWFVQGNNDELAGGSDDGLGTSEPVQENPPDTARPDADAPDQPEPDDPVLPDSNLDSSSCPDGTPEQICAAAAFVEQVRGRPFKEFPVVEFADEGDFQQRLLDDIDAEDIADTEQSGRVLGSLGLVPEGTDLVEVMTQSLEIGVVGFYDTESKELVVRGSELDLYAELVIVHELVHAHDDQWLDLDRPELEEADDERLVGFRAVVEGNASRVEALWRAQLSPAQDQELAMLEATLFDADDIRVLQRIPAFVLEIQFFPYRDGPALVDRIAQEAGGGLDGERAIDAAILDPPTTSEQALHPEQFLNGDAAPTVPEPRAAGAVVDRGVVGELVFDLWFGDRVGDGWNGDRYISFEADGKTCTVVHVAADTDEDLDEIFDAAADWVGEAESGDLRRSDGATVDGIDLVVIEGCR
jgi:hypothetical protein